MRCCPPAGHANALETFDGLVQRCFSKFTGLHLEATHWEQATQGLSHAGLWLRSTRRHAAGAYMASVGGCAQLCAELDPDYRIDHSGDVAAALSDFNAVLAAAQQLATAAALSLSQKQLSCLVDEAGWAAQLASASLVGKATLRSEPAPGARAFLSCIPAGSMRLDPPIFIAELRVRWGVPEANHDVWCPKCRYP